MLLMNIPRNTRLKSLCLPYLDDISMQVFCMLFSIPLLLHWGSLPGCHSTLYHEPCLMMMMLKERREKGKSDGGKSKKQGFE